MLQHLFLCAKQPDIHSRCHTANSQQVISLMLVTGGNYDSKAHKVGFRLNPRRGLWIGSHSSSLVLLHISPGMIWAVEVPFCCLVDGGEVS
jgi:hypothetical protein